MHVWPLFKYAYYATHIAAYSKSADESTTTGHLPPSSRMHGVKFLEAAYAINLPFCVLPVKMIKSTLDEVNFLATST